MERQHRHDDVFGNRGFVAKRIAHGDAGREDIEVEQIDPGRDRLHEPHHWRRPVIPAPMVADEDVGCGRRCGQAVAVDWVVEDLDLERGRQLSPYSFRGIGGHLAEKQCFHGA